MAQQIYDPPDLEGAGGRSYLSSLDAELVLRSLNGDSEAFSTLFDRHAQRVTALAYNLLGDRAEAEDITQDAFLQALSALPTLRQPEAFGPWVLRIATNAGLTALRRRGRLPQARLSEAVYETHPDSSRWGAPEAMGLASEEQRSVHVTLTRLAPSHRAALAMREIGGLSYAEMARALGTTPGGVEALLFRARARFRDEYNKVALGLAPGPAPKATTCRQARRALAALADDELAEPRRVEVVAHVRGCHTCTATLQAQRDTQRLLMALPIVVPSTLKMAVLVKVAPILATYGAAGAAGASVGGAVTGGVIAGGATLPSAAAGAAGATATGVATGGTAASITAGTALAGATSGGAAGAVAGATAAGAAAMPAATAGVAAGAGLVAGGAGVAASAGAVGTIAGAVAATAGAVGASAASSVSAILPIIATGVGTTGAVKVAAVIVAGAMLTGALLGQSAPATAPRPAPRQQASSVASTQPDRAQFRLQLAKPTPVPLMLTRSSPAGAARAGRRGRGSGPTTGTVVKARSRGVTPRVPASTGAVHPATFAGAPTASADEARPGLFSRPARSGLVPAPASSGRSGIRVRKAAPARGEGRGRRRAVMARTDAAQHAATARPPQRRPVNRSASPGSKSALEPTIGQSPGSGAEHSPRAPVVAATRPARPSPSPSPTPALVGAASSAGGGAEQAPDWSETGSASTAVPSLLAVATPAGGVTPAAGDAVEQPAALVATPTMAPSSYAEPLPVAGAGAVLTDMTTPSAAAEVAVTESPATVPVSLSVATDALVTATTPATPSATMPVTAAATPDQALVTPTVPISATAGPVDDQSATALAGDQSATALADAPDPSSTADGNGPTSMPTATGDEAPAGVTPTTEDTATAQAPTSSAGSADQNAAAGAAGQASPPDAPAGQTAEPSPPAPTSTGVEETPSPLPATATATPPLAETPTAVPTPTQMAPTPDSTQTAVAPLDSATPPTPTALAGMDGGNGLDGPGSAASATSTPDNGAGETSTSDGPAIDDGSQQPGAASPTATMATPDVATAVPTPAEVWPTDTPAGEMDTTNSDADGDTGTATVVPASQTPDPQPPAPDDATPQGNLSADDGSGPDAQASPTATVQALVTADASTDGSGNSPDVFATAAVEQTAVSDDSLASDTPTQAPVTAEAGDPSDGSPPPS